MKRMKLLSLTLCFVLAFSPICFARGFEPGDTDGVGFHADTEHAWFSDADGNFEPGNDSAQSIGKAGLEVKSIDVDTVTATTVNIGGNSYDGTEEGTLAFTAGDFVNVSTNRVHVSDITRTNAPGLVMANAVCMVDWANGETSPIQITHSIPNDYTSGGAYRITCTETTSVAPYFVDMDVYVNREGATRDSSATNQTAVRLAGQTTPNIITITPATDFSLLYRGKIITASFWPLNTYSNSGNFRIEKVEFVYQRK